MIDHVKPFLESGGPQMPPHRQIFFNGEMLKDTSSLDDLEDPPLGDLFPGSLWIRSPMNSMLPSVTSPSS